MVSRDACRRCSLEKKLADADVSEEEVNNILKQFEKKETEYMRLQRHKMSVEDFELLTMIGKGAFGEVMINRMIDSVATKSSLLDAMVSF
jgi:serine/threonine kinase 38